MYVKNLRVTHLQFQNVSWETVRNQNAIVKDMKLECHHNLGQTMWLSWLHVMDLVISML
jgi:hypothetical protein